jgi:hypothetical protein|tara:strand:- start:1345 stop:2160 length:816 start_codon:yes stop_codon:yes gene_type:complete
MDKFIAKYQQLILSCVWLIAGILFCGYSVIYQPMVVMSAEARQINRNMQIQTQELERYLKSVDAQGGAKLTGEGEELVAFLKNINKLAEDNNVIIRKLVSDEQQALVYNIEIIVDYYTFIRFATDLESLDVIIEELEVHPYNPGAQPPEHFIAFSITQRNNASPKQSSRIERLKTISRTESLRNPFQRFARTSTTSGLKIDLTWVYKFTGMGRVGGEAYATIDSGDFKVGEELDGKVIAAILKDRVYMNDRSVIPDRPESSQYVLKFRPRR